MNNVIGQIFTKFSSSYLTKYQPNYDQKKVFNKIVSCKTESLGTRIYTCEECGHKIYTYN